MLHHRHLFAFAACSLIAACGTAPDDSVGLPSVGSGGAGTSTGTSTCTGTGASTGTGTGTTTGTGTGTTSGTATSLGSGGVVNACEVRQVDLYGSAPEMLIVFDRSLSMQINFRWQPSVDALKSITHDYERLIAFGLEYFPGDGVDAACGPGSLAVPTKTLNATAIAQSLDGTVASAPFTPTAAALDAAATVLGDRNMMLDQTRARPAFVLLVTDGQPTCTFVDDPAMEQATVEAAARLKAMNIPTYVLGYQIEDGKRGVMNSVAMAGGTDHYYPTESAADIQAAFGQITKDVVRCDFELNEQADPARVDVKIDGQSLNLDPANGWVIDGKTVTLKGQSCATLKSGGAHPVSVQVACEPLR